MDGQQLDHRDPERFEIGRQQRRACVRPLQLHRDVHHAGETRLLTQQLRQPRRARVHCQVANVGLIDHGILGRQLGSQLDRRRIGDHDALGRPRACVELPSRQAGVEGPACSEYTLVTTGQRDLGREEVVGQLRSIWIEQHLVGVEPVALGVDIGDETGPGVVPCPGGHMRPVRAPAAKTIERAVTDAADHRPPHTVGAPGHVELGGGHATSGRRIDLQQHPRGGRCMDRERRRSFERAHDRTQRPVRCRPTAGVHGVGLDRHGREAIGGSFAHPLIVSKEGDISGTNGDRTRSRLTRCVHRLGG